MSIQSRNNFLTPDLLIHAYSNGFFPMADDFGDIEWHCPDPRAIIPINSISIPRSLRKFISKENYFCTLDKDFEQVIIECGNRESTWINDEIIDNYIELHRLGYAHSVETWQDGKLVGGLYGVAIGGAYFGESMFSKKSNASKAAFYHLADLLKKNKFILLDSQYINDHTSKLGAIEIPRELYFNVLAEAISYDILLEDV